VKNSSLVVYILTLIYAYIVGLFIGCAARGERLCKKPVSNGHVWFGQ